MQKILLSFLCIVLCSTECSFTQEGNNTTAYRIGLNTGMGFIMTHSPSMKYITAQHIGKQELYFEKSTDGSKIWSQRYGFPEIGLGLSRFQLNNKAHFGNALALAPYFNFTLTENSWARLTLKPALGIGYVQKPFDVAENHKNVAIGSQINLFFSVSLNGEFDISETFGINLAAYFSHFSNTSFQKPNLGINIPTIESGVYYRFGDNVIQRKLPEEKYERKKANWMLLGGFGINEVTAGNKKYLASSLSISREKQVNYKSSLALSLDFYYNSSQIESLRADSIYIDHGIDNLQVGLSFYHVLHFGKFGVISQAGYYLKSEDESLTRYYQLAGGRIQLNERLSGYFGLKTHFARAEFLLVGLNYRL